MYYLPSSWFKSNNQNLLDEEKQCFHSLYKREKIRIGFHGCTMGQNRKKHRLNSIPIIHCPTNEGVSEQTSEWEQYRAWAKRIVRSKRKSKWCERTSEWMSKWPSTVVWILDYSGPQWVGSHRHSKDTGNPHFSSSVSIRELSIRWSHKSWIFEKWAEFEQNSKRNKIVCHLKDDSKTSTRTVRQNACCPNSVQFVLDAFLHIYERVWAYKRVRASVSP